MSYNFYGKIYQPVERRFDLRKILVIELTHLVMRPAPNSMFDTINKNEEIEIFYMDIFEDDLEYENINDTTINYE